MNHLDESQMLKTARTAGIWYLLMAISGIIGFAILHPKIYVEDPQNTLILLTEKQHLARLRLITELIIIISQVLTALWFYQLFRKIHHMAAWAVGIWGTLNAVMILLSAQAIASSISIALSDQLMEQKLMMIELLSEQSSHAWQIGGLFFGLWLIPLGLIIIKSKRMPIWLGRTLIIGGVCYVADLFLSYLVIDFFLQDYLTIPATIGEFWMIGYLLLFGIRPENQSE